MEREPSGAVLPSGSTVRNAQTRTCREAEQSKHGKWHVTNKGGAFLGGEILIPLWIWPEEVELLEECKPGSLPYIHELQKHDHGNKGMHLEKAVPA